MSFFSKVLDATINLEARTAKAEEELDTVADAVNGVPNLSGIGVPPPFVARSANAPTIAKKFLTDAVQHKTQS